MIGTQILDDKKTASSSRWFSQTARPILYVRCGALLLILITGVLVYYGFRLTFDAEPAGSSPAPDQWTVLGFIKDFRLTDTQGQECRVDRFEGQWWIVQLMYVQSADDRLISQRLTALQKRMPALFPLHLVSISVDPTDSPRRLRRYAATIGANVSRWTFLSGSSRALLDLIRGSFRLGVDSNESGIIDPNDHSQRLVLIDPQRRIRGYYDGTSSTVVQDIANDLSRLDGDQRL